METIMRHYAAKAVFLIVIVAIFQMTAPGCGSKEEKITEKVLGNWTRSANRNFILLIIKSTGTWESTVRVSDVTAKIVQSKGKANGTWHIEDNSLVFSVMQSEIDNVWKPDSIMFNEIIRVEKGLLELQTDAGQIHAWKRNLPQKKKAQSDDSRPVIPMDPIAVNLNKNRSADKDRYLCLNMNIILKELMPGTETPGIHPKTRDAAIVFLSSLIFDDVKDFDRVKAQKKKLITVLNPYMEGVIEDIEIDHVLIASTIDKVEEFMIEHTLTGEPEEGESSEESQEETDDKIKNSG
ncbi:MAG: flagellar basal body-associated protein FliL [Desulfobacteraceae bacterium]|nr:MAG: flagellar basal body-associated protein FliL [Desulfobacteraceae bacterium]